MIREIHNNLSKLRYNLRQYLIQTMLEKSYGNPAKEKLILKALENIDLAEETIMLINEQDRT